MLRESLRNSRTVLCRDRRDIFSGDAIFSSFECSPAAATNYTNAGTSPRRREAGENLVVVAVLDLVLHVVVDDAGVDGEQRKILLAQMLVDGLEVGGL
jgi:hypothetical protein